MINVIDEYKTGVLNHMISGGFDFMVRALVGDGTIVPRSAVESIGTIKYVTLRYRATWRNRPILDTKGNLRCVLVFGGLPFDTIIRLEHIVGIIIDGADTWCYFPASVKSLSSPKKENFNLRVIDGGKLDNTDNTK